MLEIFRNKNKEITSAEEGTIRERNTLVLNEKEYLKQFLLATKWLERFSKNYMAVFF